MSDLSNRMRMIRILSGGTPKTEVERLEKIRKIAALEITPDEAQPKVDFESLSRRLKEGQASRSPRNAADIIAARVQSEATKLEERVRKRRPGRDRKERAGYDRAAANALTSADDPTSE